MEMLIGPFPVGDMDRPLSCWAYGLAPFQLGIWIVPFLVGPARFSLGIWAGSFQAGDMEWCLSTGDMDWPLSG